MAGERLTRKELFIYALPMAASSLQSVPFTGYLAGFYSTEMGLPLALVGLAISVTRISDIFTDIILGMLSDRLRTRWGRRKPMIAAGLPLAALATWMLFVPQTGASVLHLFGWIIVFNLAISMLEVPYGAWGAELSTDYHERTRATGWRTTAVTVGALLCLSIPFILQQNGHDGTGTALLLFAGLYVFLQPLFYLPLLILGRERPPRNSAGRGPSFRESIAILWGSSAFRILSLGLLLFVGGKAVGQALNLIVISEVVNARHLFPTMLVLENVCGLAAVPAWMWLARRFGKQIAMLWAALWSGLWSMPLFFLGQGDGWLFVGIIAMRAISLTAWVILIPSMTADAVDVDTLAAGRERTGVFFGAIGFSAKAAGAMGILIGTSLPALAGFQPSDPVHSPDSLLSLRIVYAIVGPLLVVASAFCFGRFPIDQRRQGELRAAIDARNAEQASLIKLDPTPG